MAFHVSGEVTVSNDKANLVLNLKDPVTYLLDMKALWDRISTGEIGVHPTRQPLDRTTLGTLIHNIQRSADLKPTGLKGAWNPKAEDTLIRILASPKRCRGGGQASALALPPVQPFSRSQERERAHGAEAPSFCEDTCLEEGCLCQGCAHSAAAWCS